MIKHDVAVSGVWYSRNYGSLLNGYATYKLLKSLGYSVVMLNKPDAWDTDPEIIEGHNVDFINKYYPKEDIGPILSFFEQYKLNNIADCFISGSDQIWRWTVSFRGCMYLPWCNKKKISFSTSLGSEKDEIPDGVFQRVGDWLWEYDKISVREGFSQKKLKDWYGLKSDVVAEPVFCLDKSEYGKIAAAASWTPERPYICCYILDPTFEKTVLLRRYAAAMGLDLVCIMDGNIPENLLRRAKKTLPNLINKEGADIFLKVFMNAEYVITDSFHGTCFSIIFNKPFTSITNEERGAARFYDILNKYNLSSRLLEEDKFLNYETLKPNIDFSFANQLIQEEKAAAASWLKSAIDNK